MRMGQWTFVAVRRGRVLFAASERSEEILGELPYNKPVMMEARSARNPQHHELFFAILDRVVKATGRYPNSDALNKALKFQLGITEEWFDLAGELHIVPGSIAWSAMSQEEFGGYFDQAMLIIGEHFFSLMTVEQIADIEELIAGELGKRAARGGRGEPDK